LLYLATMGMCVASLDTKATSLRYFPALQASFF
jgi:hypothetical protein